MVTVTVGTDLVEIGRLHRALEAHARLGGRLFTAEEWSYCQRRADPYPALAARFAAKEAVRKIFGQWGVTDLLWTDTEVATGLHGAPQLVLHGAAQSRGEGVRFALSLAHTETHAQAVCIAYGPAPDE